MANLSFEIVFWDKTFLKFVWFLFDMKLNLGCNRDYRKGWVNVDIDKAHKAEVYHDLDKYPYPFKKDSADFIEASHIVEHLKDPFRFMKEMHTILKKDGKLRITVPHYTNPMAYTPQHRWFFSYKTIKHMANDFDIVKLELTFTPMYTFMGIFARWFPVVYENSPLRIFPCKEIVMVVSPKK